jgi:uncharacterized integral membrane protein (TIGR00697 family)
MERLTKERKINIFVLSSSLYVSFQLFANILSTKIAVLPFFHLAIDGGTVIYPLTFTLRDFVHKTHGKRDARQVIIIAAALNAVMFGLFWLVGKMTPDPTWQFQKAYEQILLPVGRIVLASIVAQIISELIDTEIFSYVYKKISDTSAVFVSNSISLVIDSFIFSFIAFAGALPFATVMQIVVANILIKFVISTLSVPTIKLIPRTAKFEDI